ncbi:MAG: MFS transporter [Spirochaetes bacterium]|nr:MFS transporter [Spirochaetota bacterium]
MTQDIKVYGYRWIILFIFALLNIAIQIHWISFASITSEAAAYYNVTPLSIGLLSMLFMIVYVFISIPASYIIDTHGIKLGIGIGAALIGIFGLIKGLYAQSFVIIVITQIALAIAQPFILNAYTRLSAKWFPIEERATATGIASLAQYLGIICGLAATPFLVHSYNIPQTMYIYGIISCAISVVFIVFMKEEPPTPPCEKGQEDRFRVKEGLKHIFSLKQMWLVILLFFIGLGMFNAVTTWIEQILQPRGFNSEQAGITGASMMAGGILGAIILPLLSDHYRKRKAFLTLCMSLVVPGLAGLTFANNFTVLLISSFILGFFMMSAGPIGFQYAAEISYPAPESSSQGLLLLSGQISGIIFIFAMDAFRTETGAMTPFMIAFIVLMVINALLTLQLKESQLIGS